MNFQLPQALPEAPQQEPEGDVDNEQAKSPSLQSPAETPMVITVYPLKGEISEYIDEKTIMNCRYEQCT